MSEPQLEDARFYRHYSTLRFTMLPFFAVLNGSLATVAFQAVERLDEDSADRLAIGLAILGVLLAVGFVVLELRLGQLLELYGKDLEPRHDRTLAGSMVPWVIRVLYGAVGAMWLLSPWMIDLK